MYEEIDEQLTAKRKRLTEVEAAIKYALETKVSYRPETTLSLRACQLAAMWLGKAKGALGITNPYPQSFNPESKHIEDRVDVGNEVIVIGDNEIEALKTLRAHLKGVENQIGRDCDIMPEHRQYQICLANAYTYCSEATMWLGMSLNEVHEEGNAPKKPKKGVVETVKDAITGKKEKE